MKLLFAKINKTKKEFRLSRDDVLFTSSMFFDTKSKLIEADIAISGSIKLSCDRCLDEFDYDISQNSKILLSDGEYRGDNLDVVEFFDNKIDLDFLLDSELESIKSDYHLCKKCKNIDEYEEKEY